MTIKQQLVILGAGIGGLSVLKELADTGVSMADVDVTIVDEDFSHFLGFTLPWVMRGWRDEDSVPIRPDRQRCRDQHRHRIGPTRRRRRAHRHPDGLDRHRLRRPGDRHRRAQRRRQGPRAATRRRRGHRRALLQRRRRRGRPPRADQFHRRETDVPGHLRAVPLPGRPLRRRPPRRGPAAGQRVPLGDDDRRLQPGEAADALGRPLRRPGTDHHARRQRHRLPRRTQRGHRRRRSIAASTSPTAPPPTSTSWSSSPRTSPP